MPTCITTMPSRIRCWSRRPVVRWPLPDRSTGSDSHGRRHACGMPITSAERTMTTVMNAKARASRPISSSRGSCDASAGSNRRPAAALAVPQTPPSSASHAASQKISRRTCEPDAPSANRTAVSPRRSRPRMSESNATLAQATRSTTPTEPRRTHRAGPTSPTVSRASGDSRTPQPLLVAGYSAARSRARAVSCSSALAIDTPLLIRATAPT